jgi:hypothetical protein
MRHNGEDPVAKMPQQNPRDSATSGTRSARRGPRVFWLPTTTAALACCQASTGFLGCGSLRLLRFFFFLLFSETFLLPIRLKKYLLFNIGTKRDGEYYKRKIYRPGVCFFPRMARRQKKSVKTYGLASRLKRTQTEWGRQPGSGASR